MFIKVYLIEVVVYKLLVILFGENVDLLFLLI